MKSLSPNAQEFVPLSLKNQNMVQQQPMQTYFVDPNSVAVYNIGYQNLGYNYQIPSNYQFYPSNQIYVPPLGSSFNSSQFSHTNQSKGNQVRKPWNNFKQKEFKKGDQTLNMNANEFPSLTPSDKPNVISTINMNHFALAKEKAEKKSKETGENKQISLEMPNLHTTRTFKDAILAPANQTLSIQQEQHDQNCEQSKNKKSKSKKKSKKEEIPKENKSNQKKIVDQNFSLNVNDFPDLSCSLRIDSNKSLIEEKQFSDAYSSDATMDASIIKLHKNSQLIEINKQTKPNSKKIHQPLTIEFANMISALQKGQNFQRNQIKIQAKAVANLFPNRQEKSLSMQLINPLDSSSTVKRGKEREKPKSKKKSTLKKIILREREEKRKKRDDLEKSDHFDDTASLPNLSYLFSSPKTEIAIQNDPEDDLETNKSDFDDSDINNEILSPISQPSPISINGYNPSPYAALDFSDYPTSLEKLEEQVKQKIHSRKFREYCNQIISKDIDEICLTLLQEIARFQDRLYQKFPNKAKNKRRYVMGIREVTKHLKLQKIKCVIIAPNCEKIESKGGLDDAINSIIQIAMEQNIPFLFALGRKDLGKAVRKLVPISVIGIFDYSGAEEHFKRLVELANNAKLAYQDMVEDLEKEECENLICQPKEKAEYMPSNFMPKIPSHMAHSRTPSNGSNISIEPIYHMNYHTHSRSASGNFNYGPTTLNSGHSRTASGGGLGTSGLNLDLLVGNKNWTHSRTPSNCSNNSFMSRVSEPISEINYDFSSAQAAVQFYSEQVRQEMKENDSSNHTTCEEVDKNNEDIDNEKASASLSNLHLGCINEIDAGNEADTEER